MRAPLIFVSIVVLTTAFAAAADPPDGAKPTDGETPDHTHDADDEHELKFFEAVEVSERADDLVGIEDVHFHPMEKPTVRLTATWRF
jgi:hypothetical protein